MVKADELRRMVSEWNELEEARLRIVHRKEDQVKQKHFMSRRSLIPEELKRLERIMTEAAQHGKKGCVFSLGTLYAATYSDDPVHLAIFEYCAENGLKCEDVSYDEPVGFHEEIYRHCLKISW